MKKSAAIISVILITALVYLPQQASAQSPKKYSAQEVKDDLRYMYETLEKSNYDLYALVKKEEMDSAYHAINSSINDSLTFLETYRLFQPFVARVGMSHCNISKPWYDYMITYLEQGGTVFPLSLHFSKGKVYVKDIFSPNTSISKSDEVLSINEVPIDQYMKGFYKSMSGPSDYYKESIIEAYSFPRLNWIVYGECKEFKLKIKKRDGEELDIVLNAISAKDFEAQLEKLSSENKQEDREFHMINNTLAYLRPGKFSNANGNGDVQDQNTWDNSEFCQFIDSAFLEFNNKGSKDLILDLRDNTGGDNSFSDYMIAYFATKAFGISSRFSKKTSQMMKDFWKDIDSPEVQDQKEQIISLENGSYYDLDIADTDPHTAKSKRFEGKVYVLINRYSYSNAAYVAAIIQDYKFGEIVGEETAEEVTTYVPMHTFNLPHTRNTVSYPTGFAVRPNGDATLKGVVPDHIVFDDEFTDKDEILEYTIELIGGE
jgi:C-terminal processing protease CtpA/Prc